MRTIRIKLYKFDELSKAAQKRAIQNCCDINVNMDFVTQDASDIGLDITEWQTDSASFFYNVRGEFTQDAFHVAENILREHDQHCETYKDALRFMAAMNEISGTANEESDYEVIVENFLCELLISYKDIMQSTYEDQASEYQIVLSIKGHEIEFTKDGNPSYQ